MRALWTVLAWALAAPVLAAPDAAGRAPEAMIDLATREGAALVKGEWRYSDVRIVPGSHFLPGADGQPGTIPVDTYDFAPKAGAAGFDDRAWPVIDPATLSRPRGNGKVSFAWYRIGITVPERVGSFDTAGSTVVFDTRVDDYAEIWVDGEIAYSAGETGGHVIAGWNAANRVVLARNVKPGQRIQVALFGVNGPISRPPTNYIYLHYARLEFHRMVSGPRAIAPQEVNIEVERLDPEIDRVVSYNPKLFKLAEGFIFTEGPVWVRDGGYLLFSDPNANTLYRYSQMEGLSVFRRPSGYDGADIAEYGQPGSNGLTLDAQGRLTINEHGNHRVSRLEADGSISVLAERFDNCTRAADTVTRFAALPASARSDGSACFAGRLNSPNDLVYKSDGALYFTDPPFGLPKFFDDPRKALPFSGVYRVKDGHLTLLVSELTGPNGIAFSPDEKFLYVGNWDEKKKVVMRYPVLKDGTVGAGTVFFDMTAAPGEDAIDGIKVDTDGRLYVSGPGGLWVIAADGRHLGTIRGPKHPHNLAWGEDGNVLYLTAQSAIYRLPLKVRGIRP
jgi:gluconolactonase